MSSPVQALSYNSSRPSLWLYKPSWDLMFISLSAVLVALPFTIYVIPVLFGIDPDVSRNAVNIAIAFLIGGPHMYSTYSRTLLDPTFQKKKSAVLISSIVIPIAVIYFGIVNFIVLLSFFIVWASIHVLDQIVYLVDCYNQKASRPQTWWSRAIEYTLVLSSLYPWSVQRLVHGTFIIGHNVILFPPFLKHEWVITLIFVVFFTSAAAYVIKTIVEFSRGQGHLPKTLLITFTAILGYYIPSFENLDVAFQGFNTWHSFQYLGLTWYVNKLRRQRGEPMQKLVWKISGPRSAFKYYGFTLACTSMTLVIIAASWALTGFSKTALDQCYYIPVLCVLLTHYYHDHFLFRHPEVIVQPVMAAG